MSTVRRERASYTVEQVAAIVNDTLRIADDANLTYEDRSALLPAIFDKVAAKEVTYEQVGGVDLAHLTRPGG